MLSATAVYERAFYGGLRPDPRLTVSQWADEHRWLSSKASAEPGRWRTDRTPYLRAVMDDLSPSSPVETVVFVAGAQVGKALAVDTPIATPTGWTTMGDIKVGDFVFGADGKPTRVDGVSAVFEGHRCYRVEFSDGESVVADEDHLWTVDDSPGRELGTITLRTSDIASSFRCGKNRNRYAIPVTGALLTPDVALPIDPYVLGVWLGDGNSACAQVTLHVNDLEIADHLTSASHNVVIRQIDKRAPNVANLLIDPVGVKNRFCKRGHDTHVSGRSDRGNCKKCTSQRTMFYLTQRPLDPEIPVKDSLTKKLRRVGALNNKHIPTAYLRASIRQRLALLQGLMDTDGYCGPTGRCEFSTSSQRLADGFMELARSLGLKPSRYRCKHADATRISFMAYSDIPIFRLTRKRSRLISRNGRRCSETLRRRIVNVQEVDSVPTRCIRVQNDRHLFLAGRAMIPTHNTESGNNWIGFCIDAAPGPFLFVSPSEILAKRASKQRIEPLIEVSPRLREKITPPRERDSGNTLLSKEFPGGMLMLVGANKPANLRSVPIRYLFMDEVDAYPESADKEGDPVLLAEKRTATFARRKKIYKCSTPTLEGSSRIWADFEDSDQNYYHVPCPFCGAYQVITWGNIHFTDRDPSTAMLKCVECEELIPEHHKTVMLANGQWIPKNPGHRNRGYHLSALYSPLGWYSWASAVKDFLKAGKNPQKLKVFVNTVLGETYRERGDAPEWEVVYRRREEYPQGRVPYGAFILTAGVDVQADRLEVEVVGWGRNGESWSIEYVVIYGDTGTKEPWEALERLKNKDYDGEAAPGQQGIPVYRIRMMAVDSGFNTQKVYEWVRKQGNERVMAVKGQNTLPTSVGSPRNVEIRTNGKRVAAGVKLWPVGVDILKIETYERLRLELPVGDDAENQPVPQGYCHFPMYEENYFKMLTAEQKVVRIVNGSQRYYWTKIRDRNEALDCRVYARAAAAVIGVDRYKEEDWRYFETQIPVASARNEEAPKKVRESYIKRREGSWLNRR